MAFVIDNLVYSSSYTPFERPPEGVTLNSLIPRGIRRFFIDSATSIKPVNDDHSILVTAILPDQFAYILVRYNMVLFANQAGNWESKGNLRLFNHIPGQPLGTFETLSVEFEFMGGPTPVRTMAVRGELANFCGPMWSTHAGSISFRSENNNLNDGVASAGTIVSHVDFLEYDLVQAQRWWINTPTPVLQR